MQNDIEILQFFPTSLCSINLPEMVSDFWEKETPNIDFYTENNDPHWQSRRNILDNYTEMKELFVSASKDCLKQLGYDQEIKITTSWLTAIAPNATPTLHRHSNSWFSGVYYFQDLSYSGLEFKNPIERDIDLKNSKLTGNWRLEPKKNRLVVFPSYLYHKIEKNTSDEVRHSLAFNIMPDGIVGSVDSEFEY